VPGEAGGHEDPGHPGPRLCQPHLPVSVMGVRPFPPPLLLRCAPLTHSLPILLRAPLTSSLLQQYARARMLIACTQSVLRGAYPLPSTKHLWRLSALLLICAPPPCGPFLVRNRYRRKGGAGPVAAVTLPAPLAPPAPPAPSPSGDGMEGEEDSQGEEGEEEPVVRGAVDDDFDDFDSELLQEIDGVRGAPWCSQAPHWKGGCGGALHLFWAVPQRLQACIEWGEFVTTCTGSALACKSLLALSLE
jgi:hypothetical protein